MSSRKIVTRAPAPKVSEEALTRAVAGFLDVALLPGSVFTHVASGEHRVEAVAVKLRKMGVRRGCPDFVIAAKRAADRTLDEFVFRSHVVVFIELKSAKGALSAEQKAWRSALEAAGAWWFLCRSVEEVEAALKTAGAALKAKTASTKKPPTL